MSNPREVTGLSVQAIEGDDRHQSIISQLVNLQRDPSELTAYLQSQALATQEIAEPTFAEARKLLPDVMSKFSDLTSKCIEGFIARTKDDVPFEGIEEGAFRCRIGQTTGWLRVSFQVDDVRFVLMVAPDV